MPTDKLHSVENCGIWCTVAVHGPGFPLREELSCASTPGHHTNYLNGLLHRFDESWCIKNAWKWFL